MKGDQWGPYLLEEKLPGGGMAEVFRARRVGAASFGREVCIKRIHEHLATDPDLVAMFLEEAKIGSLLDHKNIVVVQDFGERDGRYFLTMEFVNGVDLKKLEKRLTTEKIVMPADAGIFVAHELTAGLRAAHTARDAKGNPMRLVHRDICPHNVLVSFSGAVKLADFGLARVEQRARQTQGDVTRGRIGYMPLEQSDPNAVDARTDLYALGVTLFEMFTGKHPFGAAMPTATMQSVLAAQATDRRDRLQSLRPDLPPGVVAVIEQMLSPDPANRPRDASAALEVFGNLTELLTGEKALAALLAELYPSELSVVAIPRNSIAPRASVPPNGPNVGNVDPFAATTMRPSQRPASDDDRSAPPRTTDTRDASPQSPNRVPPWALALAVAVIMAGATLAAMQSRRRTNPAAVESSAPVATNGPPPVTTLLPANPPAIRAPVAPMITPTLAPPPASPIARPATRPVEHATATQAVVPVEPPAPRAHEVEAPVHVPVAPGSLRVVALPWGEVFIDGTSRGRAPVTVTVNPGEHVVRITGGVEHTEHVMVTAGATRTVRADAE